MKKAWSDLRSFITVFILGLFGYCIILQLPIPEELKNLALMVVSYFLGAKSVKDSEQK